ncbi:MAG: phosphonate ABC transporter, permease protein PhnE [Pseudolabrys sp.]
MTDGISHRTAGVSPTAWRLDPPYGARTVMVVILGALLLWYTGQRVEIGRMLVLTGDGLLAAVGIKEHSQVSSGLGKVVGSLFPLQISERTEVTRIEGFDPNRLPWLSHVETVEHREQRLNPQTLAMEETVERKEFLIEPLGYLGHVLVKMIETLEIALWGTIIAVILSVPLAYFGAKNYTPNRITYFVSRSTVSLFRAVPELVSALFLVLAYGFGPIAGVLALGIHAAGFLGKFYAEDIENADNNPQEALRAIGANKVKVIWYAVLPQVIPQYIAYTLYILDRNVRMATVVGLVGAGGIGQELKGRYDIYNYSHVGTILVVIFMTVFLLDQISARLRSRYV